MCNRTRASATVLGARGSYDSIGVWVTWSASVRVGDAPNRRIATGRLAATLKVMLIVQKVARWPRLIPDIQVSGECGN